MKQRDLWLLGLLLVFSIMLIYDLNDVQRNPLLFNYRLSRILSVISTGIIIGLTGVYLQSSLRNPLVDHYILGIGSGSLVFTYLSILIAGGFTLATPLSSMLGGLLALFLTIILAEKLSGTATSYVLAGIGINSFFSGISALLSYLTIRVYPYAQLLLVGSFIVATDDKLYMLSIPLVISASIMLILAKPLNTLEVSDEFSVITGFNPRVIRLISIIVAGLTSSIVTSLYGLIGFIGLASPHIARYLSGRSDNRVVAPLAAFTSSIILYVTDFTSRRLFAVMWSEIPAGAIASLIGAPFFIYLLLSRRRIYGD
ncbi:FecCD family ABC transporter permease [Desulfurococcus amylolyticus]|uniref:Transport system permease protein n=1 Tax=Desulfurococcus amylolyticus DSM 16532 TaxID=768672 RepID=I3XPW0_DESAM|nr:iron ABC transporter permease [Desulfurococcus amylolyticus]AFL65984.1 transport system permease protein [Desulfurococcus amylolyticus DSM 16532]